MKKRARDPSQLAKLIVDIAAGDLEESVMGRVSGQLLTAISRGQASSLKLDKDAANDRATPSASR
jgi:hypothetical protein